MPLRDGKLFIRYRTMAMVFAVLAAACVALSTQSTLLYFAVLFALTSIHMAIYGAD